MSRCIRIGHIRVNGTAVSTGGSQARVGCAEHSVCFLHREGSMVTRVAVQSRGPRNTHREVTYLLGSPAICMRVAVFAYADKRLNLVDNFNTLYTA